MRLDTDIYLNVHFYTVTTNPESENDDTIRLVIHSNGDKVCTVTLTKNQETNVENLLIDAFRIMIAEHMSEKS